MDQSSLIEEDDKKNKKDLFDILMSSGRMDEQRISPPHHVITQTTPTATPKLKTIPNTNQICPNLCQPTAFPNPECPLILEFLN